MMIIRNKENIHKLFLSHGRAASFVTWDMCSCWILPIIDQQQQIDESPNWWCWNAGI